MLQFDAIQYSMQAVSSNKGQKPIHSHITSRGSVDEFGLF